MSDDDGALDAMMEYDADYDPCERIYCAVCGCDYPCGDQAHEPSGFVGESVIRAGMERRRG